MQTLEDPFYYLVNFEYVLDWVASRYGDLLSPAELAFIDDFVGLPKPARALLVRMVMRKGSVFRASKLRYAEIGSARDASGPLVEKGWVDADPQIDLEQLSGLLTKPEIVAVFGASIARPAARKSELLAQLQAQKPEPKRLAQWWPDSVDRVFALTLMDVIDRLRLMFFGNLRQGWSEFVLADLGLYRFETVEFSHASRAFQRRAEVDQYLALHRCREAFEVCRSDPARSPVPLDEIICSVPAIDTQNTWLEDRRSRLLYQLAYYCERDNQLDRALQIYCDCTHPEARVRRIRVLERKGDYQAALDLARDAGQAPGNAAESQHLLRILPRLHRKLGLPRVNPAVPAPVDRIDLVLPRPAAAEVVLPQGSVETAVREHLHQPESPVWFVENTLINSLFGLLCWDAVFAPVPGAFFHRFHTGPADLFRPDFCARRAGLFDAHLGALGSEAYKARIRQTYRAKYGLQSPFVYWDGLDETLLELALACIPAEHLLAWFRRLLEDIRANRAGMPDLIRFWPEERRYQMIEVKGPGDRLQDNQLRWLDFCARHNMPVQVCYVQWSAPEPLP